MEKMAEEFVKLTDHSLKIAVLQPFALESINFFKIIEHKGKLMTLWWQCHSTAQDVNSVQFHVSLTESDFRAPSLHSGELYLTAIWSKCKNS